MTDGREQRSDYKKIPDDLVERLARIEAHTGFTKKTAEELKARLYGNGQPGDIHTLYEKHDEHSDRLTKIENWKWYVMGTVGGALAIFGLIQFLQHL